MKILEQGVLAVVASGACILSVFAGEPITSGYQVGLILSREENTALVAPFCLEHADTYNLSWLPEYTPEQRADARGMPLLTLAAIPRTPIKTQLSAALRLEKGEKGETILAPDFELFDRGMSYHTVRPIVAATIGLKKAGNAAVGPLRPHEVRSLKSATISHAAAKSYDIRGAKWGVLARLAQWRKRRANIVDVVQDVDAYVMEVGPDLAANLANALRSGNGDTSTPRTGKSTSNEVQLAKHQEAQKLDQASWIELVTWAHAQGKTIEMSCPLNGLVSPLTARDVITPMKETVFWMEDHTAVPDIIRPIAYPNRGVKTSELMAFPESVVVDGEPRPANTVSGVVFWLLRHRDAPPGDLDLMYQGADNTWQGQGVWVEEPTAAAPQSALKSLAVGTKMELTLKVDNRSKWMEYTAVLRAVADGADWEVHFLSENGKQDVTSQMLSPAGLALTGSHRLQPAGQAQAGFSFRMSVVKKRLSADPHGIQVRVFSHPGSTLAARDALAF